MTTHPSAAERWSEQQRGRGVPPEILAAAPESPYGFPAELFRTRGEAAASREATPTTMRALEALPAGGSVLDVGVGGGATSLPLAGRASTIIAVDAQQDMLEAFAANAAANGIACTTIAGAFPEVADEMFAIAEKHAQEKYQTLKRFAEMQY